MCQLILTKSNAIIEMISGAEVRVNTATFKNDTVNIKSKDDVLTYMIHLGYLGYNQKLKTAFVPNEEIRQELTDAVESRRWSEMLEFQKDSERLLDATLDMDGTTAVSYTHLINSNKEITYTYQYYLSTKVVVMLAISIMGSTVLGRVLSSPSVSYTHLDVYKRQIHYLAIGI